MKIDRLNCTSSEDLGNYFVLFDVHTFVELRVFQILLFLSVSVITMLCPITCSFFYGINDHKTFRDVTIRS